MSITLATKVYTFSGFVRNAIAYYFNRDASVPSGFKSLSCSIDGSDTSGSKKVRWKLKLPTVSTSATTDGAVPGTLIRENFVDVVVTLSAYSTQAERDEVAQALQDLTATTEFQSSVKNLVTPSA